MEYIDKRKAWTALKAEAESHELPASKEAYKRAARIIEQMQTRYGCRAGIARSPEDAVRIVEGE